MIPYSVDSVQLPIVRTDLLPTLRVAVVTLAVLRTSERECSETDLDTLSGRERDGRAWTARPFLRECARVAS